MTSRFAPASGREPWRRAPSPTLCAASRGVPVDEVDWCQEFEEEERRLLIRQCLRTAGSAGSVTGPAGTDCADCGEPIPPERRRAQPGARLCVSCQSEKEKTR
ncbi:TraR/DksA C4-type zinc finger protein [Tepidicaulis marinus]|uniref:TraR/DksA C4-type zinc finger protein n=1 Tax=Tepidicaulis marinus TaxID=1333998 RepID=UPI0009DCB1FE